MSGSILAIDPGPTMSAFAIIDPETRAPQDFGKWLNEDLLESLRFMHFGERVDTAAIEMVSSYGMPVGAEVFDTCVWTGRFLQALNTTGEIHTGLIVRRLVKLHHCHSARATDANIRQALVDRFAPGQPNGGKGTKANPGVFHGIKADVWQAYALAVYIADLQDASYQ